MRNQRRIQFRPASALVAQAPAPQEVNAMQNPVRWAAIVLSLLFVVLTTGAWSCAPDADAAETAARDRGYLTRLEGMENGLFGEVQVCNEGETTADCFDRRLLAIIGESEEDTYGEAKACNEGESKVDCINRRGEAVTRYAREHPEVRFRCVTCIKLVVYCITNHEVVAYGRVTERHRERCQDDRNRDGKPDCTKPVQPAQPNQPATPENGNRVVLVSQPGPFTLAFGNVSGGGASQSQSAGGGAGGSVTNAGNSSQSQSAGGGAGGAGGSATISDSGNSAQSQSQGQTQSVTVDNVNYHYDYVAVNNDVSVYVDSRPWFYIGGTTVIVRDGVIVIIGRDVPTSDDSALCEWLRDYYGRHPTPELRDAIRFFCGFDPEEPPTPGPGPTTDPYPGTSVPDPTKTLTPPVLPTTVPTTAACYGITVAELEALIRTYQPRVDHPQPLYPGLDKTREADARKGYRFDSFIDIPADGVYVVWLGHAGPTFDLGGKIEPLVYTGLDGVGIVRNGLSLRSPGSALRICGGITNAQLQGLRDLIASFGADTSTDRFNITSTADPAEYVAAINRYKCNGDRLFDAINQVWGNNPAGSYDARRSTTISAAASGTRAFWTGYEAADPALMMIHRATDTGRVLYVIVSNGEYTTRHAAHIIAWNRAVDWASEAPWWGNPDYCRP